MENLIYSLNATIPVFLVILTGYLLKRIGMLNDEFVRVSNRFNFRVTLPCLLFRDLAGAKIKEMFDLRYVLFCAIVTSVMFFAVWFLAKKTLKDKRMAGAFVQASFRSSAAVLGIAFIQNIYGNSGMAPLMIVGTVPLFNIYSVIVLTVEGNSADPADGGRDLSKIKKAIRNIFTNPIILSIAVGLVSSLLDMEYPAILNKTVNSLAAMASPLALIAIGAGFEGRQALAKIRPSLAASCIKLVGLAAVFLPVAYYMGFRDAKMMALIIMLASPTTPSCYIMAKSMGGDDVLTSSIIVMTTLLSAFTLTAIIYVMKSVGAV